MEIKATLVTLVVLTTLLFPFEFAKADPTASIRACNSARISWDFSADQQDEYTVEMWSSENGQWRQCGEKSTNPVGHLRAGKDAEGNEIIQQGRLHRVRGCTDDACVSSPIVWSPWLTCPGDQTHENIAVTDEPIEFRDHEGNLIGEFTVAANGSPERKVLQHNINLVRQQVLTMADKSSDEYRMVKPEFHGTPERATYEDWFVANIYYFYENARTGVIPDLEGTLIADQQP